MTTAKLLFLAWFLHAMLCQKEAASKFLELVISGQSGLLCWLACVTAGDWTRERIWLQDYLQAGQWIFSSPEVCLSCFRHAAESVL